MNTKAKQNKRSMKAPKQSKARDQWKHQSKTKQETNESTKAKQSKRSMKAPKQSKARDQWKHQSKAKQEINESTKPSKARDQFLKQRIHVKRGYSWVLNNFLCVHTMIVKNRKKNTNLPSETPKENNIVQHPKRTTMHNTKESGLLQPLTNSATHRERDTCNSQDWWEESEEKP